MKTNDLNFYPDAAIPATPPAGGSFADPTFGTQITRVTDRALGAGFAPGYSAIYDLSNADDTRITFLSTDSGIRWIADVDPNKRKVSNIRRLGKNGAVYWSRVNPDVLFCIETWNQATLSRYHCAADKWDLVADLSRFQKIAVADTSWIDSRGMSWDDDRFHCSSQNSQSVFVYSASADKLVGVLSYADALKQLATLTLYGFLKTQMDAAGRLVLTASEELLINLETGVAFAPGFGTPTDGKQYGDVHPDFAPGVMACGGMGGIDNTGNWPGIVTIDPADLPTFIAKRRRIGPRVLFGVDTHTSARQANGKWLTLTHDGGPAIGADAAIQPIFGNNEIYQLDPTGPPDGSHNRRIVQHLSFPNSITDAGQRFWAAARGCGSQAGKFVGFNSIYGNGAPDVYLAWIDEEPETFTVDQLRKLNLGDFAKLLA